MNSQSDSCLWRTVTPFYRWFLPKSLFGRLFLLVSLLCCSLVLIGGYGIYQQTFEIIDQEANHRLLAGASAIAARLGPHLSDPIEAGGTSIFHDVLGPSAGLGWIRNVYWVNLSGKAPEFLATLSFPASGSTGVILPSLDQLEDILDEGFEEMEAGRPFFPDPLSWGGSRRFKIIFMPLLEQSGFLHSFVGLEADSHFFELGAQLRSVVLPITFSAIVSALFASLLLARSVSRHADRLVDDLSHIERRNPVLNSSSGIREFDTLHQGIKALGHSIVEGDRRLHQMYEQKLNELFFTGAAIAHEIRNPLAALELHFGLVKRKTGNSESLQEIELVLSQMKNLVSRFLSYSKKVQPHKQMLNALQFFQQWAERFKSLYPQSLVEFEIPDGLRLFGDPDLVAEILDNLGKNSSDAVPDGLCLSFSVKNSTDRTVICVCDNGPGIPSDIVPQLFMPFSTGKKNGTGLGLALVRKFVEAHHGEVYYESGTNCGARFLIVIPAPPHGETLDKTSIPTANFWQSSTNPESKLRHSDEGG